MHVIDARNVHEALAEGVDYIWREGVPRDSRNGPVLQAPGPVMTVYNRPLERVLFHVERDANPFFHLIEGLWMLAGRDDVATVARYAKNMANYSDDGETLHGAYGKRWRGWFGDECGPEGDQLARVIEALRINPDDRRQVLSMWDPYVDPMLAAQGGKDVPCNTHAYPQVAPDGKLDLTICCRSNDMIWGAHGANAVHFSMLLEYLAYAIDLPVGRLYQFSNNYHGYRSTVDPLMCLADRLNEVNPYVQSGPREPVKPFPLMGGDLGAIGSGARDDVVRNWERDLKVFMERGVITGFSDPFFRQVVTPVELAWQAYKRKMASRADSIHAALENIDQCQASDWKRACTEWLLRRAEKIEVGS